MHLIRGDDGKAKLQYSTVSKTTSNTLHVSEYDDTAVVFVLPVSIVHYGVEARFLVPDFLPFRCT